MNLLFISYHYPPTTEVGATRAVRFCRYLPEYGVTPIVLTVNAYCYEHQDPSLPLLPQIQVERTGVLRTPLDLYAQWKRTREALDTPEDAETVREHRSHLISARRQLRALLQTPDPRSNWYFPAIRKGAAILRNQPVSAIFSSGPPWTCHLIGRHLKKKFGIPWIADFRDPWMADPWRWIADLPSWRDRLDGWLESSCIRNADAVISTTEALRQEFLTRYPQLPRSRFAVITNGVDDAVPAQGHSSRRSSKTVCLHVGDLYSSKLRRIDTFCRAVADLIQTGKLSPETFQIVFVGSKSPSNEQAAAAAAPELVQSGCIEFRPRVSRREAEELLEDADILLIFQGNHRLSLPSKFFDYLKTGKPILAIVEPGALSDMVERTGTGASVAPGDSAAIGKKLLEVLQMPRKPSVEIKPLIEQFHFRNLAGQLAQLVEEVASEH